MYAGKASDLNYSCRFVVQVSHLELYNEQVRDLLSRDVSNKLKIRESQGTGIYVEDLSWFNVKNAYEMDKFMAIGNRNSELLNGFCISQVISCCRDTAYTCVIFLYSCLCVHVECFISSLQLCGVIIMLIMSSKK